MPYRAVIWMAYVIHGWGEGERRGEGGREGGRGEGMRQGHACHH